MIDSKDGVGPGEATASLTLNDGSVYTYTLSSHGGGGSGVLKVTLEDTESASKIEEMQNEIDLLRCEVEMAKQNTHLAVKIARQLIRNFKDTVLWEEDSSLTKYVKARETAINIIDDLEPDPDAQKPQVDEDSEALDSELDDYDDGNIPF